MSLLKLYQVATPTVATQVTTTKATYVKQAIICNSGANACSYGDSTLGAASTGITLAANTIGYVGHCFGAASFDLSELFVIAATGNVNVLVVNS